MRAILYLSLVISSVALASSKSKKNAYVEDVSYKSFLSTKTPYRFIGNTEDSEEKYTGCEAKRVWAVYRHGTRTVGPSQVDGVYRRLTKIRTAIIRNSKKPGMLAKWLPHPELDDEKRLTSMGAEELNHMGQRFRNRFSSLIPDHWNNRTFVVRATDTTRAQDSARNFLTGLFDAKEAQYVWMPTPLKKDPVLRFYKLCPRWRDEVKKNPETKKELKKFLDGPVVSSMIDGISRRFNLPPGFLNIDDLQLMYTVCAFETSWDRRNKSPWCKIFKKSDLKVLEYAEDLELYWFDGYGKELNTKLACPMFKDAFAHLSGEKEEPFVFYFTHCGAILKFLTHLGLYHDDFELTSDNFFEHEQRMWRTSQIAAFGSNLAFVRYDCVDGKKYVLTLHQENPIRLPGCPEDSELCSLDTIEQLYKDSLENCDYGVMCASTQADDRTHGSSFVNSTVIEHEEDKS